MTPETSTPINIEAPAARLPIMDIVVHVDEELTKECLDLTIEHKRVLARRFHTWSKMLENWADLECGRFKGRVVHAKAHLIEHVEDGPRRCWQLDNN